MKIKTIAWDGRQITKPGIYSGISLENYHAPDICVGPSISSSGLRKIFNESPAHFYADWSGNPGRKSNPDVKHFVLGRAMHHLLLGEPFFAKLFVIQPEDYQAADGELKPWNNNAKVCRDWAEERRKQGRSIITKRDVDEIKGMAAALGQNALVRHGILNGLIERSIFWKDKATGIWLKARPDNIPGDSGDFVDLKTTTSVFWNDLVRTIGEYGYHAQGGMIRAAARDVMEIKSPTFTLVFIEKKNPYCVRVVTLKDNDLDRGEKQNRVALDKFAECIKSKHWPGPGCDREDAENIELSEWEQNRVDERIKFGI